jgi:hypothetical protein
MKSQTAVCLLLVLLGVRVAMAANCAELLDSASRADLSLSVRQFDQDAKAGWRALQDAGCIEEAGTLIDRYLIGYESNLRTLLWHRSQLSAMSGKYAQAVDLARRSLNPVEAQQHPKFKWNAYVLATIAFLQADKEDLARQRSVIEMALAEEPLNEVNLSIVKGLERCFKLPYQRAYSCEGTP